MLRSLIQLAAPPSVQPSWGRWLRRRDETPASQPSGTVARPGGVDARLPPAAVYALVTVLIALSCTVNIFSHARDIAWRLGAPHNLWEPALWEITSGTFIVALVPLARGGAPLVRTAAGRPVQAAFGIAALLLAFSTLHLVGMGLLRELAYHLAGW